MALQNTGTIKNSELQTEFSGPTPSPISSYYRNGAYVPGTVAGNVNPPNTGNQAGCNPFAYTHTENHGNGALAQGSCFSANNGPGWTTMKCSNISFDVGCQLFSYTIIGSKPNGPGGCWKANVNGNVDQSGGAGGWSYSGGCGITQGSNPIYNPGNPGTTNPNTEFNLGVPESGTIKLSNFYGATN